MTVKLENGEIQGTLIEIMQKIFNLVYDTDKILQTLNYDDFALFGLPQLALIMRVENITFDDLQNDNEKKRIIDICISIIPNAFCAGYACAKKQMQNIIKDEKPSEKIIAAKKFLGG